MESAVARLSYGEKAAALAHARRDRRSGAVRLLENRTVADEFQILIQPKYFKKMNRKVSSLTGIKDAVLRESGVPFPEAMARFRAWCGGESIFLTWGFDDITILKENLALYGMDDSWASRWYNAQLIFNAQTDGATSQRALKTALELMGIEPSRPAHDALGDAYHGADLQSPPPRRRIEAYGQAAKEHENGFHGAELPGCLARQVYHGYADKTQALAAMSTHENACPQCGGQMHAGRWLSQPGRRYMTMAMCPEHGAYLVRVRLVADGWYSARKPAGLCAGLRRGKELRGTGRSAAQAAPAPVPSCRSLAGILGTSE